MHSITSWKNSRQGPPWSMAPSGIPISSVNLTITVLCGLKVFFLIARLAASHTLSLLTLIRVTVEMSMTAARFSMTVCDVKSSASWTLNTTDTEDQSNLITGCILVCTSYHNIYNAKTFDTNMHKFTRDVKTGLKSKPVTALSKPVTNRFPVCDVIDGESLTSQ